MIGSAAPLSTRHTGSVTAVSSPTEDTNALAQRGRIAAAGARTLPGDTSRTGCEKHAHRPVGEVEGEHVEAQGDGAEQAADDELVDELDAEHDDARGGQRQPEAQQPPRDRRGSKPKRTGSACRNSTSPTSAAAMRPTARLIAPMPPSAAAIDTIAPSQLTTWSITIRRPARNSRCSSAAEVATTPLMTTLAASTRTIARRRPARPWRRRSRAPRGRRRRRARGSTSVESVATVGAISFGEPCQRTIARLTPSSLKLRTASSASRATANVPNSSGPRMRASAIPISERAEPRDQRVGHVDAERPARPRAQRRALHQPATERRARRAAAAPGTPAQTSPAGTCA